VLTVLTTKRISFLLFF